MSSERKQRLLSAQSKKSSNLQNGHIQQKSEKHQVSHSWHNSNLRPESIILALAHLPLVVKMVLLQHYHLMIKRGSLQMKVIRALVIITPIAVAAVVAAQAVAVVTVLLHLLAVAHHPHPVALRDLLHQDHQGLLDPQEDIVEDMEEVTRY